MLLVMFVNNKLFVLSLSSKLDENIVLIIYYTFLKEIPIFETWIKLCDSNLKENVVYYKD